MLKSVYILTTAENSMFVRVPKIEHFQTKVWAVI